MVTFTQIEEAIVALLKSAGLAATEADLPSILSCKQSPSFHCRITSFRTERLAMRSQKIIPMISVFLALKNVAIEKVRRQAIYPLIQAIVGVLTLQELGLLITPIIPVSGEELVLPEFSASGIVMYEIDFKTGFTCDMTEERSMNMLKLSLQYFIKPGDTVADARDVPIDEES